MLFFLSHISMITAIRFLQEMHVGMLVCYGTVMVLAGSYTHFHGLSDRQVEEMMAIRFLVFFTINQTKLTQAAAK